MSELNLVKNETMKSIKIIIIYLFILLLDLESACLVVEQKNDVV